ncbi:hypothetical protein JTE90_010596 [Oedothorax gibbosus]|uniref:Uncharacterized protein n=1 Tax=Oedothorax gibbosus TaxID=931172 RepID=A0AAV6TSF8_9ARAC|nr:hypothetical protein JTE90_010596 [Oedothorax gibbosus]
MPWTLHVRLPIQDHPFPVTDMLLKFGDGKEVRLQVQDQHVDFTCENFPSDEPTEQLLKRIGEEREPNEYFIDLGTLDAQAFYMQVLSFIVTDQFRECFDQITLRELCSKLYKSNQEGI